MTSKADDSSLALKTTVTFGLIARGELAAMNRIAKVLEEEKLAGTVTWDHVEIVSGRLYLTNQKPNGVF